MPVNARSARLLDDGQAILPTDTKVLVDPGQLGRPYSTTCSGKALPAAPGIDHQLDNGTSAQSLYGVTPVSATGLYKAATPRPAPTRPAADARPRPDADPTATPKPTPTPTRRPSPYAEGIDISHWQGVIDWTKVAAAGKSSLHEGERTSISVRQHLCHEPMRRREPPASMSVRITSPSRAPA
jgi:hypothetical protein